MGKDAESALPKVLTMLSLLGLLVGASVLSIIAWVCTGHSIGAWLLFPLLVASTLYYGRYRRFQAQSGELAEARKRLAPLAERREKEMERPSDFIFPYIRRVNAGPLVRSGENFIYVDICFPSGLPQFSALVTGHLIVNGGESDRLPAKQISLTVPATATTQWKVSLSKQIRDQIRLAVAEHRPIQVAATLWDDSHAEYDWRQIPEVTLHPLS